MKMWNSTHNSDPNQHQSVIMQLSMLPQNINKLVKMLQIKVLDIFPDSKINLWNGCSVPTDYYVDN